MPARKYHSDADRPAYLPSRLPRVVIAYLHVIVRLRRPDFVFGSLAQLQEEVVRQFLARAPHPAHFPWKTPGAVTRDDDALAFRQVNFQLPVPLCDKVRAACDQAGVTVAAFLYSATCDYIAHVATPRALHLE